MSKNNSLSPEDITLLTKDHEDKIPPQLIKVIQCVINSFQRQGLTNLKMLADAGKSPITEFAKDPAIFTKGFSSRLAYQLSAIYPCLVMKESFNPETSKYLVSLAASVVETSIGAPFEVYAAKDTLKKSGKNIESFKEFAHTSKLVFLPFLMRSYLGWMVINGDEQDPLKRGAYGALGGMVSSPIDSLGNKVMQISSSTEPALQTYLKALKTIELKNLAKAAPYRMVAAGISANILSTNFTKFLSETFDPLYQEVQKVQKNPSNSTKAISGSQSFIEELSQINER